MLYFEVLFYTGSFLLLSYHYSWSQIFIGLDLF